MSPFALELEKTGSNPMTVALEPTRNAFVSALLLANKVNEPGVHEWVERVRAKMSAEERDRHTLVMIGFFYATAPRRSWEDFSAYIDYLDRRPPSAFREILLKSYAGISRSWNAEKSQDVDVDWDKVLSTSSSYVAFLKEHFEEEWVDEELEQRAYQYVLDPDAMKELIVGHLRWFWNNHLEAEWRRVRPMLEASVNAFRRVNLGHMSRVEAARFVTGQELSEDKWSEHLETAKGVFFVPNAHIGPYLQRLTARDTLYIFFGARQPEEEQVRIPELDRAEVVARLSALADDTRLHILQMVAERKEMRSQEVIDVTGLSQPSVSRYLTQLSAAGYLHERRENGAKVYSVNFDRIEKTLKATSAFLLNQ